MAKRGGLRANTRYSGNIVYGISHECQVVGELVGPDAELLFERHSIAGNPGAKIEPLVSRCLDDLPEILVPRHYGHRD